MADNLEYSKREPTSAPFNMAVATLMRINEILQNMTEISAMPMQQVQVCYTKYKMLQQLYLAAVPLIDKTEVKKELKGSIAELKSDFFSVVFKGRKVMNCYESTEPSIDSVAEQILEALQENKYFMPPKNDPRFSWRQ